MSDSVDRVFVHALSTVKKIPRTGSSRPPPSDRLKLYGLYKQSMEGDVEGVMSRPEGDSEEIRAEREKWTAWSAQHGLSRTEAKRRYITTLISTMHTYASTTPEARELVAELEFVWDQIKSNSISSSASSPDQRPALPSPLQQSRSYSTSIPPDRPGLGPRRADPDGALRSLRPVSDGDEEEVEVDDNDDDEDFVEAQHLSHAHASDPAAQQPGGDASTRLYEIRNRKWRKRMEQALMRLTTEVAALREQLEAKRFVQRQRRENTWAWLRWLLWVAVRHLVVDAFVWGVVVMWARRKGVDRGLDGLLEVVRERAGRVRVPGLRRALGRG